MSSAHAPITVDRVTLNVADLDRVAAFYQSALGLARLDARAESVTLGAGARALLELRATPGLARRRPGDTGLFHTAFLLPDRAALGQWLGHARASNLVIQGAADHLVSEAVYLSDPEGNGIEIYTDRPRADWRWDTRGQVEMANAPLDWDGLFRAAPDAPWAGAPEGTVVGHVHLQVGALEPASAFYRDTLGMALRCEYEGARFFASGGYHHHLAANIWNSRGMAAREERTTGLARIQFAVEDDFILDDLAERATARGQVVSRSDERLELCDPWHTGFVFERSMGASGSSHPA